MHSPISIRFGRLLDLQRALSAIFLFLVLLLANTMSRAQVTQGSLVGTVMDASGSAIAGANVTLLNTEEGVVRTTQTNGNGEYMFLDVKAARYKIDIEAPDFEKWEVSGVALAVRQQLRMDATLTVGAVKQQVNVSADSASAIQTESPTISGTFTSDDIANLPVNTRASFSGTSAYSILGTLPGMQSDASGFSLQGGLPFMSDITVDGVSVKSASDSSNITDAFPSSESISEIRADGALANAEYGDPGQVVVTTKGGTNQLHGTGFWYYQSSAFNAIPYTYPTTTVKPSQHGNTFGASAGGPVLIPHFYNGHNKSFFYGAYEGWRHPAQTTVFAVVPSTLMKKGDFSKYTSTSFTGSLINPFTGQNWGTTIPTSSINPIASNVISTFFPDPNIGDPSSYVDNGVANWEKNVDNSGRSNQFDIRGDQYFGSNQKFLLWGRFTWKDIPTSAYSQYDLPSKVGLAQNRVLKVDTNWTITPQLINEGSFSFTRSSSVSNVGFDGKSWTQQQGWVGLQDLWFNGLPSIQFNHLTGLTVDRLNSPGKSFTYQYGDTLLWSKGRHTFKFGVDFESFEAVTTSGFFGDDNYGSYNFNSSGSAGLFNSADFADFLLGLPYQTAYDIVLQDNDGVAWHYHAFAQDDWRLNSRLTVSYGIRYELQPGYYDKGNNIGNFNSDNPLSGGIIYPDGAQKQLAQNWLESANACNPDGGANTNTAEINGVACMPVQTYSQAGFPAGLRTYPKLRFMPRLGFAYRPFNDDTWAIRGGFGMYNISMMGSSFYSLTGTVQASTAYYHNSYNSSTHQVGFQWPQVYAGANGACSTCYGTDYFGTANSVHWKDPYTEQWMLSIDHDFGQGYAGRISYIGSESHQLVWGPDENTLPYSTTVSANNQPLSARLYPNWGVINNRSTGADASYQSLQLEASHRLQNGLEYHSVFTYAKALADNQGPAQIGFAGENGGQRSTTPLSARVDFGNVYGTRRLRWNTTALYDLPIGRGRLLGADMSRVADLFAGGWRLTSILTVQTGAYVMPYFPGGQGDPSGTGSGLTTAIAGFSMPGRDQHPDDVPGISHRPRGQNRLDWTNSTAFACPGDPTWTPGNACTTGAGYDASGSPIGNHPLPIGRFGNNQVGSVEGPGLVNLSAGLSKSFALAEGIHMKLEGTFTNVLNHTNLGDPNMDLSSTSFGLISSSIGSDFGGARTGQVAARLEF